MKYSQFWSILLSNALLSIFLNSHFFCFRDILRTAVCSTKTTDYITNLLGPITYIKWGTFFFSNENCQKKIGQFQISKKYVQSQNEIAFEHNSYIMCVWYFVSDIFPIESFFCNRYAIYYNLQFSSFYSFICWVHYPK